MAFGSNDTFLSIADIPAHTHTITGGTTGSTGGTGATASNYQPSLVVHRLIALSGIYPSPSSIGGQTGGGTEPSSPNETTAEDMGLIGETRLIAGATASGFLAGTWEPLNGELYAILDNDALFNLIGTTYGGDGQDSFAVPDLRGRVSVSVADPTLALGEVLGSPTLNILVSQLASHAHLMDLGITGIERLNDASVNLFLKGMAGSSCKVELSDDGATWSLLGQVQFPSGTGSINDPNAASVPKRYYRAR